MLARRISSEGRTRAYINGRSAAVGELRDAAQRLLTFYGQHEHRRLTLASSQLDLLDAFCGSDQSRRREQAVQLHAEVAAIERSLDELRDLAGARERELDLLVFELAEIENADISEDERLELVARRERLRHVEALRAARRLDREVFARLRRTSRAFPVFLDTRLLPFHRGERARVSGTLVSPRARRRRGVG